MSIEEKQSKLFKTYEEKITHQFQLIEEKIRSLIELTEALKQERTDLVEKVRLQEETLDTLSKEVGSLRAERQKEEHRILTLIERANRMVPDIN